MFCISILLLIILILIIQIFCTTRLKILKFNQVLKTTNIQPSNDGILLATDQTLTDNFRLLLY